MRARIHTSFRAPLQYNDWHAIQETTQNSTKRIRYARYEGPLCQTAQEQHTCHLHTGQLNGTRYGRPWEILPRADRDAYRQRMFRDPKRRGESVSEAIAWVVAYEKSEMQYMVVMRACVMYAVWVAV